MNMLQVFHMNKGQDDASYAKNCYVQKKILSLTKTFVEEAIQKYLCNEIPETITIGDFGCSSGPTALKVVSEIIDMVIARCRKRGNSRSSSPKFMVFLNDLPGNDFNGVFASISDFQNKLKEEKGGDCFIAGLPGSFYGRLLPPKSLNFVHSSSSLHWLSQAPSGLNSCPMMVNKGKIYLSVTSPIEVINAYIQQFRMDFLTFLACRAEEVISGGRLVLTLMGRTSIDPTSGEGCYPWEFISQCLTSMCTEGLIGEKKLDSFNVPYYAPCLEEIKALVEEESSFCGHRFEAVEVEWDGGIDLDLDDEALITSCRKLTIGERIAKMHRAVTEPMLEHQFGEDIMDDLFHRYARVLDDHFTYYPKSKLISLVVSLIRK